MLLELGKVDQKYLERFEMWWWRRMEKISWIIVWEIKYYTELRGDRGGTVVTGLCYKSEGRWFDPRWCHWNFSLTYSSRSHNGPRVDSVFNRNEYQENFLGVNAARAYGWKPYHLPAPLSWNLGTVTSWKPLGHSRPVTGLIYLFYSVKEKGYILHTVKLRKA